MGDNCHRLGVTHLIALTSGVDRLTTKLKYRKSDNVNVIVAPRFLVRFHDGILGLPAVAIDAVGDFPLLPKPVHDLLMSQATRANPAGAGFQTKP